MNLCEEQHAEDLRIQKTRKKLKGALTRLLSECVFSELSVRQICQAAGITTIASPNGFIVPVYNIEKTICDVVRSKDKMDYQVVMDALKSFSKRPDKNLTRLMEYAKLLRIESAIRTYFEVLL